MTTFGQFQPSRYVKRCERCRDVKGNSQFPRAHGGRRGKVCQSCTDLERNQRRAMREQVSRLAKLRRDERALQARANGIARKLGKLREAIRDTENQVAASQVQIAAENATRLRLTTAA